MSLFFFTVFLAIIAQRLAELRLARRNARLLKALGGVEVGSEHYKYVVYLHVMFFVCLLTEASLRHHGISSWQWFCFLLFLVAQLGRYWCIKSLGMFWNTRILILPGARPVRKGPYRYLRHPNYWIVGFELLLLPLVFSAYVTAITFPLLHLVFLLRYRLPVEEEHVYR
ncbi:isoprenylcysteine carboxyl methyltransferase family protein [Brevibacillus fluminis]|uniref:isoprenylcysteine carboxyl methyltransferase family protein n=1 Tax=Brevibacillus fluminis TaxID=511487 RepID=UPI003F89D37F